jgi:type VI secretion system protein ImpE
MTPLELFQDCRLAEAIAAQQAVVEQSPDDIGMRLVLCDFLAHAGRVEEVSHHLDHLSQKDSELEPDLTEWRQLLQADLKRQLRATPEFLISPPKHVAARFDLQAKLTGEDASPLDHLDELDGDFPCLVGYVDGREFEGWCDIDDFLKPVLEAFVEGRFVWIPLEQIRKLRFDDEEILRDRLYRPARVWLTDESEWDLYIPALYSDSQLHEDEVVQIGAATDYLDNSPLLRGIGLRQFLFGEEELSLGDFQQVEVRS